MKTVSSGKRHRSLFCPNAAPATTNLARRMTHPSSPFSRQRLSHPPYVNRPELAAKLGELQSLIRRNYQPAGRLVPRLPGVKRDPRPPDSPYKRHPLARASDALPPHEAEQRRLLDRRASLLQHLPIQGRPPVLVALRPAAGELPRNPRPRDQHHIPFGSEANRRRAVWPAFRRGMCRWVP